MKITRNKDIWQFRKLLIEVKGVNPVIIIPTNLGWKNNGCNVMGVGIAKQAVTKFPNIADLYGCFCRTFAENINDSSIIEIEVKDHKFLMFPTKPLIKETPNLSWKQNSCLKTIEKSCKDMVEMIRSDDLYLLPLVGCGNGKLDPKEVRPLLSKYFEKFDNVILFLND